MFMLMLSVGGSCRRFAEGPVEGPVGRFVEGTIVAVRRAAFNN